MGKPKTLGTVKSDMKQYRCSNPDCVMNTDEFLRNSYVGQLVVPGQPAPTCDCCKQTETYVGDQELKFKITE